MAIGSFSLLYHYCDQLQKHRPKNILDLGIGFGMMGALVRQYLSEGVKKDKTLFPWGISLTGIEGFEGYRNPAWDLYDNIIIEDIRNYVPSIPDKTFDFIIFSDVLEHMSREEGESVIHSLMRTLRPGGVLMIGTPGVFVEQGPVHGNEYERHKSLWKWNEFPPGFEVIKNGQGDEFGHYMILVKYVKPK